MKLKSLLLAALLATSFGTAYADDYTAPTVALNGGPTDWTVSFGTSHVNGPFTDTYTFVYSGLPGAAVGFFANVANSAGSINFGGASLNGEALNVVNSGWISGSYFENVPVSGILTLIITGTSANGASYAGTLDVSAVPEPATYGMLLGGLALVGMAARRRKPA